ncbi:MAG: site-specific DNA-methyltransferase, partial [Nitrososphaera sp.]|nr:site-specific DNA-methyltransferase [Nitrososphaera sp.]
MMYPRLYLARNLLTEDGIIFISIDDNEADNLKRICNEVFGEENFVGAIVVQANKRGQTYKEIAKTHEYLFIYSHDVDVDLNELEKTEGALPYKDSSGPYDLWELRNRNPKFGRFNRPNLYFPVYVAPMITDECGYAKVALKKDVRYCVEIFPVNSEGEAGCWRWGTEKIRKSDLSSSSPVLVAKQKRDGNWNIYEKSRKGTTKAKSLWTDTDVISEKGTMELGELGLAEQFEHPKPVGLISRCIKIATNSDDVILDFFAGAATTAHAILDLNQQDGGNRKFILVQLPEPTGRQDYPTIGDITKERVRRVIKKLNDEDAGKLDLDGTKSQDRGFRVFKLFESNFKHWEAD